MSGSAAREVPHRHEDVRHPVPENRHAPDEDATLRSENPSAADRPDDPAVPPVSVELRAGTADLSNDWERAAFQERLGVHATDDLPDHDERIKRIEKIADLLDSRFKLPVLGSRVGLDGLIGLIPGIGDTLTTAITGYLIHEAWQAGARKTTIGQMVWNAGVDWAIGLIPLVGDIFDFAHKANAKNARLLVADLRRQKAEREGTARA